MGQQESLHQYGVFIGDEVPGETRVLRDRNVRENPLPKTIEDGIDTLWKVFENSVKKYPNNRMMGNRERKSKDVYGEYHYKTYKEIHQEVIEFSTGLVLNDLVPEVTTKSGQKFKFLGIYSRNREEWMVADIASHMNSVSIVTFYDTLGDSTIEFILGETNLTSIVMETTNLHKLTKLKEENKQHSLQNIIILDNDLPDDIAKAKELGFKVYTFEEICEKGKQGGVEFTHCKPETLATLSYTSGTTGTPKGTMLTHGQLAAELTCLNNVGVVLGENEMYLSYLPLAHAFERVINLFCMYIGACVAFYSGSPLRIVEDAKTCNPTVFIAVPRVMMKVYDKIIDGVKKSNIIKRKLFEQAVKDKLKSLQEMGYYTSAVWDTLVFNKIKSALGTRTRLIVIAGAPIDKDTADFLKICFCCPIILGYGATESCGAVSISITTDRLSTSNIGGPIPSIEVKLVDVPELNYTSKDVNPETGIPEPRGEILVRGPVVFKEYLNDPENTKKAFSKDGWLRTGDVGIILTGHGNAIRIIDRVKSIFKLTQGEYIAPEKIENILSKSKYISQIYITGKSDKNYIVAVVVPERESVIEFLATKNITSTKENVHEHYADKDLLGDIIKDLETTGRTNELKGFELVKRVFLTTEPFSIENNLMTPTMKLKRNELKKKFAKEIDDMYN